MSLLLILGNENEKIWKPAREELEYFDPRLAIEPEALMDHYKESPVRQRMVEVLSDRPAGQLAGKEVLLRRVARGHRPPLMPPAISKLDLEITHRGTIPPLAIRTLC